MSENIAAAIAAKNEVIAQQGTSLDEVAAVLETKAAGGTDISLGLTSAAVGQIIKVKAIDESGKPTAWEAADMPSGGGETWELIRSVTIPDGAEEVNVLSISTDSDGSQFSLKKAKIFGYFPAYTGQSSIPPYSFFELNGIITGNLSPYCYTSGWVMPHKTLARTCSIEVDLSLPGFQCEKVFRITDGTKEYFGDKRIDSITSIGGRNMPIYPGCRFTLYGVRE